MKTLAASVIFTLLLVIGHGHAENSGNETAIPPVVPEPPDAHYAIDNGSETTPPPVIPDPPSTGSFLNLDSLTSSMSFTVITQRDIQESGAGNLTDLLEIYVPGFQYMYNPFYGTLWGMRGISSDRNTKFIVLVNNHMLNMQSRDGFKSETVLGMLGDIKQIEVLRGPASLVYGSGAIAGIVNIITRDDRNDTGNVSYSYGTVNGNEVDAYFTKKIDDCTIFRGSFGMKNSKGMEQHASRLYGIPPWPFPGPFGTNVDTIDYYWDKNGVPSDGNHGATPGNYRVSLNWYDSIDASRKLETYIRFTRQVESAGGLFITDPWPEVTGGPPTGDTIRSPGSGNPALVDTTIVNRTKNSIVDGVVKSPNDRFWNQTESYGDNRRQYIVDNLMAYINYTCKLKPLLFLNSQEIKIKVGFDKVSNTTALEARPGYDESTRAPGNLLETFGEWRLSPGLIHRADFNLNNMEDQFALGAEYRLDGIGDDWLGRNEWCGQTNHNVVSDVYYNTLSLFGENFIRRPLLHSPWMLTWDIGGRLDLNVHGGLEYTRTTTNGTSAPLRIPRKVVPMSNGKIAFGIYSAGGILEQSYKLIFQTSSNNGSTDNYLPNRYHYNNNGTLNGYPVYEDPLKNPNPYHPIIPPYDENLSLRPERIKAFEFMTTHSFARSFYIVNSISYGWVDNLFAWSQSNFRVKNAGNYEYFNWDADIQWVNKNKKVTLGINNTWQKPCGSGYSGESDKQFEYTVINSKIDTAGVKEIEMNMVKDAITADGKFFLNLSTDITKIYATYRPFRWLSVHSDSRIFWGLMGRKTIQSENDYRTFMKTEVTPLPTGDTIVKPGSGIDSVSHLFNYWNTDSPLGTMIKLNASLHFYISPRVTFSFFAYDILGFDNGKEKENDNPLVRNSLRWLQIADPKTKGLVSTDQRSFAAKISCSF